MATINSSNSNGTGRTGRTTAIRLIVPRSLLEDLTFIAKSKFISRLALIRLYLKQGVNQDLVQIKQQAAQLQDISKARNIVQRRLDLIDEGKANKPKGRWEDSY